MFQGRFADLNRYTLMHLISIHCYDNDAKRNKDLNFAANNSYFAFKSNFDSNIFIKIGKIAVISLSNKPVMFENFFKITIVIKIMPSN